MISCPSCDRNLPSSAQNCPCGWEKGMRGPVPKMPEARPERGLSWEEGKAAYERAKATLDLSFTAKHWTRERFVAHYLKMLDSAASSAYQKHFAAEALFNLGYHRRDQPIMEETNA